MVDLDDPQVNPDDRLAADVALLRELQQAVLQEAGAGDAMRVADDLLHALQRHPDPAPGTLAALADALPMADAEQAARALTVHFHLVNLAEERHRVRQLLAAGEQDRADLQWPALEAQAVDPQALRRLRIHPVLTAHPTEARRRAVSAALRRIAHQLDRYDEPQRGPVEKAVARRRLLEDLEVLWRTAYLRTTRPTPLDEVRTALAVFDDTLLRAVPRLYRTAEAGAG